MLGLKRRSAQCKTQSTTKFTSQVRSAGGWQRGTWHNRNKTCFFLWASIPKHWTESSGMFARSFLFPRRHVCVHSLHNVRNPSCLCIYWTHASSSQKSKQLAKSKDHHDLFFFLDFLGSSTSSSFTAAVLRVLRFECFSFECFSFVSLDLSLLFPVSLSFLLAFDLASAAFGGLMLLEHVSFSHKLQNVDCQTNVHAHCDMLVSIVLAREVRWFKAVSTFVQC